MRPLTWVLAQIAPVTGSLPGGPCFGLALGVGAAWLCACATAQRDPAASKSAEALPERSLTFQQGAVLPSNDVLWQRAALGDPQDLDVLAQRQSGVQLMEIAERGGPWGAVALKALSHSSDAREARGRMCELLADVRIQERYFVLQEIHALFTNAVPLHEELAAEADETCSLQLEKLLKEPTLPPSEKDLAQSTLSALK